MLNLRLWRLAVTFQWYPVWIGCSVHKWAYKEQSSWWHGAAYLGRVKVVW